MIKIANAQNLENKLKGLVRGIAIGAALAAATTVVGCKETAPQEENHVSLPSVERTVENVSVFDNCGLENYLKKNIENYEPQKTSTETDQEIFDGIMQRIVDRELIGEASLCLDEMSRTDLYTLLSTANTVYNEDLTERSTTKNASKTNQMDLNGYVKNDFSNPFNSGNTREKRNNRDDEDRRDHNPALTPQDAFDGMMKSITDYELITPYVPYLDQMNKVDLLTIQHRAEIAERRAKAAKFQNSTEYTKRAAFNASRTNDALKSYIDLKLD